MQIKLQNVRLSFPHLFIPKSVEEGGEKKYSANFLLSKDGDAAQIDAIRKGMFQVATEKWGAKLPAGLKKCLQEGDTKDYDGYGPDVMFLSTSCTVRPSVLDRQRAPLTIEDGRPYAGCVVHCVFRLWAQDNSWGKRINAQLQGVQFIADGEAFGAAPFDANAHFDAVDPVSDNDGGDNAGFDAHRAAKGERSPGGQEIDPKTGFPVGF